MLSPAQRANPCMITLIPPHDSSSLCGDECENVSHVLWECSAYSSTRACFIKKLQELLEDEYEDFESLDKVEKSSYVLGSELWESKFDGLLSLVKEYIIDVWEIRKHKL